jgi:hypothetical protein
MGAGADWFRDNVLTMFGGESTDERAAEQNLEDAQGVWDDLEGYMPSQADLMGISPGFGGGMPDDWYDNWLQQNPQASGPTGSGYTYAPGGEGAQRDGIRPTYVSADSSGGYTTVRNPDGTLSRAPTTGSNGTYVVGGSTAQNEGGGASSGDPYAPGGEYYGLERPSGGGGSSGGQRDLMAAPPDPRRLAEQAWMAEQMRTNPYFGLDQYGESQMEGLAADPRYVEGMNRAIDGMQGIWQAGGYTEQERGQNRLAQQDAARFAQSQRAASQQQAAMRGMNQSGASMMGALMADQGGANRAADAATQYQIAGQQRALDALSRYGDMNSQQRTQSFNEQDRRRSALDDWNRSRSDQRNAWTEYRGQQAQQGWQNRMGVAAGRTGQLNTGADYYNQQAQQPGLMENIQNIQQMSQQGSGSTPGGTQAPTRPGTAGGW